MSITFLKIHQTKLGFYIAVLDYDFILHQQEIVLIFFIELLTFYVNTTLTDYQRFTVRY